MMMNNREQLKIRSTLNKEKTWINMENPIEKYDETMNPLYERVEDDLNI